MAEKLAELKQKGGSGGSGGTHGIFYQRCATNGYYYWYGYDTENGTPMSTNVYSTLQTDAQTYVTLTDVSTNNKKFTIKKAGWYWILTDYTQGANAQGWKYLNVNDSFNALNCHNRGNITAMCGFYEDLALPDDAILYPS